MKKLQIFAGIGIFALIFVFAGEISAQSRKAVSAAEANGTYRDYFSSNKREFNEIKIASVGKGKLKVGFNLTYPTVDGAGRKSANFGTATGDAMIEADMATFAPTDFPQCKIEIKFVKPGQIEVTQNGNDVECGFGANVSSSGTYKKISSKRPVIKNN